MATKTEYVELADALLNILLGVPYRREVSSVAEGQVSMNRIRAEEMVTGTAERDYLAKACTSLRTGLRQRGSAGERKRQRARQDIEKFRNSIHVPDEVRKVRTLLTKQ